MCREPGRHSTLDKGHEEGGSAYANAGSSLRSPPGCSRASPPQKNRSLPTVLLYALTCDFTGGCPPPPSRSLCQRLNLQLHTHTHTHTPKIRTKQNKKKLLSYVSHVRMVPDTLIDRKSTRLNSSHHSISYAVFCLKKKN